MPFKILLILVFGFGLTGCIHAVAIPEQEASIKEACRGKDRILASRNNFSIYRCGEGDQAKYAAYSNGLLVAQPNEIVAIGAAAEIQCASNGLRVGTPEFTTCSNVTRQNALGQANTLRQAENAEADIKRRQTLLALAAVTAGAAAGVAQAQADARAAAPQPLAPLIPPPLNCTSNRVGSTVYTHC